MLSLKRVKALKKKKKKVKNSIAAFGFDNFQQLFSSTCSSAFCSNSKIIKWRQQTNLKKEDVNRNLKRSSKTKSWLTAVILKGRVHYINTKCRALRKESPMFRGWEAESWSPVVPPATKAALLRNMKPNIPPAACVTWVFSTKNGITMLKTEILNICRQFGLCVQEVTLQNFDHGVKKRKEPYSLLSRLHFWYSSDFLVSSG